VALGTTAEAFALTAETSVSARMFGS
jgi:hypothetical protein